MIKRAFTRMGEKWYDMLKNNSEHFVTWSMCGLNVSLQIEQWYLTAREVAHSAFTQDLNQLSQLRRNVNGQ